MYPVSVLKAPVAAPVDPPEWWQVLPYGEVFILGEEEPLIMDDDSAPLVLRYFANLGRDMVIDYEHQTLKDVQAPAAGWIKEMDWRGRDGLWARTEWTEKGAAYIAAREYRYFSPVIASRHSDRRIVAVFNVALTNEPLTRGIAAIAAKLDIHLLDLGNGKEEREMEFLKRLIAKLGLGAEATEDQVVEAVEGLATKNTDLQKKLDEAGKGGGTETVVASKNVLSALALPEDTAEESVIVAKIKSLSAGDTAAVDLARQVADLSGKISDMEADKLTQSALKNGQISPAELEAWGNDLAKTDPEKFKKIVLSRKPGSVIPVEKTHTVKDPKPGDTPDEVQVNINKMMGVSEESWKKYGPVSEEDA